jgi:hypothetical protein
MKRIVAAAVAALGLALWPASSVAKQAAVNMTGFPAAGLSAGQPWHPLAYVTIDRMPVEQTMWQGGTMPRPQIVATEVKSGQRLVYTLKPTGKPGYFSGTVTFPRSGEWRYQLVSNYGTRVYQYRPVTIASPDGGGWALPTIGGGAAVLLLVAAGGFVLWRRRDARGPQTVMRPA